MLHISDSGDKLLVHGHRSDQSCHWRPVFKPLAFLVFHSQLLIRSLAQSLLGKGIKLEATDEEEYMHWLCREDDGGLLNLLNVLLHICELRGVPNPPL